MALFDYAAPTKVDPYYSNIENSPDYKALMKAMKRDRTIGSVFGGIFQAATSLIPGVGGIIAGAAGKGITGQIQNGVTNKYQGDLDDLNSNYQHSLPPGVTGTPGKLPAQQTSTQPDLSQLKKVLSTLKLDPTQQQAQGGDNLNLEVGADPTLVQAPTMDGQQANTTPSQGMDWGSFGLKGGGHISVDDDGVKLKYFRGGGVKVEGGEGNDDIAMIDTTTGKDTGVRVSKGEMIVVSKDNLSSLKKALAGKDHKGVFDIMKHQVAQEPNVEGHFAEGGKIKYKDLSGDSIDGDIIFYSEGKTPFAINKKTGQIYSVVNKGSGYLDPKTQESKSVKENFLLNPLPNSFAVGKKTFKDGNQETLYEIPKSDLSIDEAGNSYKKTDVGYSLIAKPPTINNAKEKVVPPAEIPQSEQVPATQPEWHVPEGASYNMNYDAPIDTEGLLHPPQQQQQLQGVDNLSMQYPQGVGTEDAMNKLLKKQMLLEGIGSAAGYLGSAAQLGFGLKAANQDLPSFSKPAVWNDYLSRLKTLSDTGLTAAQMAQVHGNADRTYAYDTANVYNLANGNSGAALGNLGRAANSKYLNDLNVAALNDTVKNRNLANYGGAVGQDVNLDRMIFGDNYNNVMMNKQAGASLAGAGLKNMMEQAITDKYYGMGSQQWKYMNSLNQEAQASTDEKKALADYIKKNGFSSYYGTGYTPTANDAQDTIEIGGVKYKKQ